MPENISGVPLGRSVFHLTSPLIGLSHRHDDEDCRKFTKVCGGEKETKEQSNGVRENLDTQTRPW